MHNLLKNFSTELLEKSKKLVDDLEIRATISNSVGFEIVNNQTQPNIMLNQPCIGLRVLKDNKISSVSTMSFDVNENLRAINLALGFSIPTTLKHFSNKTINNKIVTLNERLKEYATADKIYALATIIKDICFKFRMAHIESLEGMISYVEEAKLVSTKNTENIFSINAIISHLDINALLVNELYVTENFSDKIFQDFAKETIFQLYEEPVTPATAKIGGNEIDVIFSPSIFASIFKFLGLDKFKATNIISRQSDLEIGKKVFQENFSIHDDPTLSYYLSSGPCDDEGTATINKPLIKKGILKNLLVSKVSATRSNFKANGSAYRAPILAEMTHEAPITEDFSNLVVNQGTSSFGDLIKKIDKGIIVTGLLGLHTANKATTEFSCGVMSGFYVEGGKIKANLVPGSWSISGTLFPYGNRKSFLENAEFSKERKFLGAGLFPYVKTRL